MKNTHDCILSERFTATSANTTGFKKKSSIYFNKPRKNILCGQATRYGAWGECGL